MQKLTLEQFLKNVKEHKLTINLDQDVYRDITVMCPSSGEYHYHITTRPGYLMITGDMGDFIFKRSHDMFCFFRNEKDYQINLGYWAEKVQSGVVREFDAEAVSASLKSRLTDFIEDLDLFIPEARKKSEEALLAINKLIGCGCSSEFALWDEINSWDANDAGGLDLDDFFESTTTSATFNYVWCCYAIVHAIKIYDQVKSDIAALGESTTNFEQKKDSN